MVSLRWKKTQGCIRKDSKKYYKYIKIKNYEYNSVKEKIAKIGMTKKYIIKPYIQTDQLY